MINGGGISVTTVGSGDGGTLTITAKTILVDRQDSQIFTGIGAPTVLANGGGEGGDISIDSTELQVINGGEISASTFGSGKGGDIELHVESMVYWKQRSNFNRSWNFQSRTSWRHYHRSGQIYRAQ